MNSTLIYLNSLLSAIKFESRSQHDELDCLSTSQENLMELSAENIYTNLNMNVEYLEDVESLEEIMNTRLSPQTDSLCPIYTMNELLNEDSLLNVT